MSEKKMYTVIGFWYANEPESAGVVEGSLVVYGGSGLLDEDDKNFQGGWSLTVEAASADEAEKLAVRQMIGEDSGADGDFEDTDPAGDIPGLLDASGAIMHDTVREQTGENA